MALTLLRAAASKASSEGLSTIPDRLVEDSVPDAKREMARKTYSKLNDHQRAVYEVLRDDGEQIQRELYEQYTERHPDPVSLRYLRETHLSKLEHYNLVTTEHRSGKKIYRLSPDHHEHHPEHV